MKLNKTLMVILLATQTLPAFAGHDGHGRKHLHSERERQHEHIKQGLKSGALTRGEADILWREQRELRQLERELRQDQRLKPWQRRYLLTRYSEHGKHIRALSQNDLYRHHPRKKSHKHHDDEDRSDRYGHYEHDAGKDDDVLLWATLGIMGVVLVDQLND